MLVHLAIRDLATIEATALELGTGLNVLTGETGAGKSIIVGALSLVLGDRARKDTIRKGARSAEVQALFRVPRDHTLATRLDALGLMTPTDTKHAQVELLIRRIVSPNGRGRVYVNDHLITVSALSSLMRGYVDIVSQHAHGALLEPGSHLDVLDQFGIEPQLHTAYETIWSRLATVRQQRYDLEKQQQERLAREDYLRFQLDELDRAQLQPGLEETLRATRERLRRAADIQDTTLEAERLLSEGNAGTLQRLQQVQTALTTLAAVDPALQPLAQRVEGARLELEDVAFECRRHAEQVDLDPTSLQETEDRLTLVKRLARRHAVEPDALPVVADTLREELEAYASLEEDLATARAEEETLATEAMAMARQVSEARLEAAQRFEALVSQELSALSMDGARVRFDLRDRDVLGPKGLDEGEIHIRSNLGEAERPLHRVASGGELSRLLLAIKTVLGDVDTIGVGIFDEIDAGMGGRVAEAVGHKLAQIARGHQVIVITHLAQVAAPAHQHLVVDKRTHDGRTRTEVRLLTPQDRTDEVARMLGGQRITARVRAHAAELLRNQDGPSATLTH